MKKFRMRGFTFIEIMLVLVVLAASIAGVYLMLKPASLKAGVEKEQRNLSQLVSEIQGSFGRTQGTYADLTVEKLKELRPQGIRFDSLAAPGGGPETKIVSKFNDSISVRPAEVKRPNDAFDIVYENLNDKKCYNFIKTFYPQSYGIYVGTSEQSVQEVVGLNEGRIASDEVLFAACGTSEFKTNQGTVVFRFYEPTAFSSVATDSACGCTPETQTQDLPCGPSQVGVIRQERTNDCSGGTPSCPAPNWSAWTTTGNTCSGAPVPMAPQTPVTPPPAQCIPGQLFQNLGCAAGETGQITQRRDVTCPSPTGVPVMGAWVTIQNTCATPSSINATCSTGVQSRFTACPVGQIGNVTERRTAECSGPFAVPVYGAWTETSRSCRVACADAGSCCQPLPDQNRPLSCPAGFWGTGTEERNSWCVAASPTTPLAWSAWHITAGGCTACPAPSTATETRWTTQGGYTCPAGQYGSNTWEREEQRSQTTTYNCPAGTPALPPPNTSAWTGWTPTGATRNPVNTCTACPANTTTPQLRWDPRSAACPIGQVGSNTWEARQTRDENTTYSCPAGTATAPSPTVTYTPWTDTGATRNVVNTCAVPACPGPNSQNKWLPTSASCPAGFVGSRDWEREQVQTRTCSSPPVWDAWGAWTDTGAIRNYVDSCVAASCPGSATDTQWVATSGPCDPGFTGTKNWEREQTRSRTCTTPPAWDAWSGWTDTGVTRNPTDTCVPSSCAGPASQTQWIPMNPGCPAGYSGTNTFEKEQIQTRTCTAPPAWDAWGGWTDTGATRNPVYTCVPNNCSIPAGTTFNWTVAGQSCTYTTAGVTPVSHGANFTANDVTPAPVGTANFACNLGVMNMTALPGATCAVGCVPPAPTDTPVYRAAPVETRTIACAPGFTGLISQERTRDEIGNDNTTWSCPGPTPTNTTTWSGTYTNFGAWTTTSDTCVPSGACYKPSAISYSQTVPGDGPAIFTSQFVINGHDGQTNCQDRGTALDCGGANLGYSGAWDGYFDGTYNLSAQGLSINPDGLVLPVSDTCSPGDFSTFSTLPKPSGPGWRMIEEWKWTCEARPAADCAPKEGSLCIAGTMGSDTMNEASWACASFDTYLGGRTGQPALVDPTNQIWIGNVSGNQVISWSPADKTQYIDFGCGVPSGEPFPNVGENFHNSPVVRNAGMPIPASCNP